MNRIDRNARELVRAMAICGLCLAASGADPARAAAQDIAPVTAAAERKARRQPSRQRAGAVDAAAGDHRRDAGRP
ncbi:MAG: hypothetical protein IPO20_09160 [Gammaproteobacteria bacterium]|nr:hypothetical protein [Gammaproteobacteria bacterium]